MKITLLIFLLLLLFSSESPAQIRDIKFHLITGKPGISLGKINGITQDPSGYMWFADQTQRCITRYDGYSMVSFRNNPLDNNSLGGPYPECMISDTSGIIWIGFNGMGLDRFDPETGRFKHFRHQANDPASLSNDTVNAILIDHLGNLWVGSYGGLDLLDNKTGKFKHYRHSPDDRTTLTNDRIRALYEDREGTLWVGAGSAFENESPNQGGLNRFNRETRTFTRYLNDPKNSNTLINNKVRAIFEDSRGTFWVGTSGDGLHTMDRATGLFKRHTYNPAHPEKLSRPPVNDVDDHITFLTEDATGAIWIGTYKAGLSRYDPITKTLVRFNSNISKSGGFVDNSSWTAYNSRDKVLWVSTEPQNLYRINPFHITIPHIASAGSVTSFFQEPDGAVWIGTNAGLIHNDRNTKNLKWFTHNTLNRGSISNNNISSICKDNKGNLWIGTYEGGLNKFDAEKKIFSHFRHDRENNNSLLNDTIYKTYVDREGLLWISTKNGLDQMNIATETFTHYQHDSKDINSLSNNSVREIFRDRQKRLWIGAYFGGGLNVMDPNTHNFKHYLSGLDIKSIYQDTDNTIWVGTTGLYRFDIPSATFEIFTDPENKTGFNNVTSIIEDNEKNLWVCTSDGIIRINEKRNKLDIFDKNHGVQNSLNARAVYKGLNDELFFGSATGYYNFFPQQIVENNKPPEVLIADFFIGDKLIRPGKNSPLREPLIKTKEIILDHNQHTFSFDFAAIDYRNPEENRHLFMLEGYDNKWHLAGAEHSAYYYNVPPGHYIFRVKVASAEGVWAEKSISISVTPPWWRTWWAYTFFGICLVAGIFIIDLIQRHRLIAKERERAREKELSQAREIEKAYNELKRTQTQLIQSEKMASLGELTAGIAHEIQNPLNFVNNFSEVSNELVDEIKEELATGNMQLATEIADDLKQNLEKINHHGKRAGAIVKGMLEHSRASKGEKQPTDINALADEYLRLSYHGLRAKDKDFNVTIETDFDESIGKIEVVPQDIGRVLLNLYNNAFYAAPLPPEGGFKEVHKPTVWVTTKRSSSLSLGEGRGEVIISVRDNGPGIPQKIIDKIFQPFFTTKPTGQGTGLGLSLSYDIIRAHGGELRVESKEGEGAEFIIKLPVV